MKSMHQRQLEVGQKGLIASAVCLLLFTLGTAPNVVAAPKSEQNAKIAMEVERKLNKGQVVSSTEERSNGKRWLKARVKIHAPAELVWNTVHEERKLDPDLAYSKILETKGNDIMVEQKFQLIPIVGTSVCVMKNTEVPNERIDYVLVKSDRFKAMEGSWVLTASEDGKSTILELSSHIDLGLPIPRQLIEGVTAKKLEKRVGNVRKMAEKLQAAHTIAASSSSAKKPLNQ